MSKPKITTTDLADLDLFDQMVEHVCADADEQAEMLDTMVSEDLDSRRRFRGSIRNRVWTRDGGVCFYCGDPVPFNQMEVDHLIPWARGGQTVESNAVVACGGCNNAKSDDVW